MQELPATIGKHPIGYFFIAGVGAALITLLFAGAYSMGRTGDPDPGLFWVVVAFAVVILLITVVQLYVYSLSYYELTEEGLHVVNWHTLFNKTDVTTSWVRIQDVTVTTTSVWSLMFAYGTLAAQTAGTNQMLLMTMVPEPEYWSGLMQSMADDAVQT